MDAFEWKVKANTIKQSLYKATNLKSVHFWKKKKILSWGIQGGLYRDELSKCSFSLGDNHREKKQEFLWSILALKHSPAPDP